MFTAAYALMKLPSEEAHTLALAWVVFPPPHTHHSQVHMPGVPLNAGALMSMIFMWVVRMCTRNKTLLSSPEWFSSFPKEKHASKRKGNHLKDCMDSHKSRPESGIDQLMCATFARQRTSCLRELKRVDIRSIRKILARAADTGHSN